MSSRAREALIRALSPFDSENFNKIIKSTYLYGQPKPRGCPYFSEFITALGGAVMKGPPDSAKAAQLGADIAEVLEDAGVIKVFLGEGYSGHQAYLVKIEDKQLLHYLWKQVPVTASGKLPTKAPIRPWTEAIMEREKLIHTEYMGYFISDKTHPLVFDAINRAQKVPWNINQRILSIGKWALSRKKAAFSDVWERKGQAQESKEREVEIIIKTAEFLGEDKFYHEYYYDFRGRRYPATAYLHEQGTDFAKALLLRADGTPLGLGGYRWLLHMLATTYAGTYDGEVKTDKIPRELRWEWAESNEDAFLSFAENPKKNHGWMEADEPWQFLAYCIDLFNLRVYQSKKQDFKDYNYESRMIGWMDGSTNGCQHLTAMTRDKVMAPYVNLVPSYLPGDLYSYVADNVWKYLNSLCEQPLPELEEFIDGLLEVKSMNDKELLKAFRKENAELVKIAAPYFWNRITSHKERRKVIKRNVMTIPYGATAYGMGNQMIEDAKKSGIPLLNDLEHSWGAYLGRLNYETAKLCIRNPMRMLEIFEVAGKRADKGNNFLQWEMPISGFPVIQYYVEGQTKSTRIKYRGKTLQLNLCYKENLVFAKGKQGSGVAPNVVHSFDALHVCLVSNYADYDVTTVHDSFGAPLGNMDDLYKLVRKTFVEIYETTDLQEFIKQIGVDDLEVPKGDLDLNAICKSEYAFL